MLELYAVSSLEKILPKYENTAKGKDSFTGLENEKISFQAVYRNDVAGIYKFKIEHDENINVKGYFVRNIAVSFPTFPDTFSDDNYISHEPGVFPDMLKPIDRDWVQVNNVTHAMWFTAEGKCGIHNIDISFFSEDGETEEKITVKVKIFSQRLPKQELIYTQWFHTDCIATHYKYGVFSEELWNMAEKFLKTANENGINMILTPVFTPALDTEVGAERPTVQLMKIEKQGNRYSFDFSLLHRWIKLCKEIGFEYIEIPHLFTQWGAGFTPKIVVTENGEEFTEFGWHVKCDDEKYDNFLSQFLPELINVLKEEDVFENTYFHISDEPDERHLLSYTKAKNIAYKYLKGCKIIDALSDVRLFENGAVEIPVPATDRIGPFLDKNLKENWCYYCCVQCLNVSNRFVAMPSSRNRSIGLQLYKHRMKGFLHWGYNFYYSRFSKLKLNPFLENDAYGTFPAGDAISVYPGENGPYPAIGLLVFNEALQDVRALKLLEKYIGFEETVKTAEDILGKEITFNQCFTDDEILNLRDKINRKIESFCK